MSFCTKCYSNCALRFKLDSWWNWQDFMSSFFANIFLRRNKDSNSKQRKAVNKCFVFKTPLKILMKLTPTAGVKFEKREICLFVAFGCASMRAFEVEILRRLCCFSAKTSSHISSTIRNTNKCDLIFDNTFWNVFALRLLKGVL